MMIKICGITRALDAQHAVAHGATALGFVFWPRSPRYIAPAVAASIARDLPDGITTVGVFVNETVDAMRHTAESVGLTAVQLHGEEPADLAGALRLPLLRAVTLDGMRAAVAAWPPSTRFLLDAADPVRRGGTGDTVDWARAAELAAAHPVILAGGLTPANVAEAIAMVRPAGVDVSSGVEAEPGRKDHDKVAAFLARAREAFRRIDHAGVDARTGSFRS